MSKGRDCRSSIVVLRTKGAEFTREGYRTCHTVTQIEHTDDEALSAVSNAIGAKQFEDIRGPR